jgi:predicted dithiol-disulfide oxidoreductase (DUF899 family)
LLELFDGRPQLAMRHFMFGPDWDEACPSCSSAADGIGRLRQLQVRSTSLVAVSRAPYEKLAAYRERMGWAFPWYSSYGSDFNYDFHATLDDRVSPVLLHFRTEEEVAEAGTRGRMVLGRQRYLDLTALGRQEEWEEPAGRATPLGLQVGGPNLRLPDEYDL